MSTTPSCLVNRFDHIEFATDNAAEMQKLFENFGFVNTQFRDGPRGVEKLLVQGQARILMVEGGPGTHADEYVRLHGPGVSSIAFHSVNAADTLRVAVERGATQAHPASEERDVYNPKFFVKRAAIRSFGDVLATFVERSQTPFDVKALFAPGFKVIPGAEDKVHDVGLLSIDHLTNNVEMGQMDKWTDFYKNIYGWVEARYFDISASKTGLFSKVLQSPDGAVKIPVNEAKEAKSQIQEFIDQHKGPGVQHIALTTADIRKSVVALRKNGVKFLHIPKTYYENLPARGLKFTEPVTALQNLEILVDGDEKGYLLQIFTENQIGPLFFEVIQRKAHMGFGEGNFKALFEAIERDQERRGVL